MTHISCRSLQHTNTSSFRCELMSTVEVLCSFPDLNVISVSPSTGIGCLLAFSRKVVDGRKRSLCLAATFRATIDWVQPVSGVHAYRNEVLPCSSQKSAGGVGARMCASLIMACATCALAGCESVVDGSVLALDASATFAAER